jgi:hypothetical protein
MNSSMDCVIAGHDRAGDGRGAVKRIDGELSA